LGKLIMWLFLLASVLTALSIPVFTKYQKSGNNNDNEEDEGSFKPEKINLKDIWEIEDVKNGLIILSGGRYRMLLRLAAVDIFLLGHDEQTHVEDALISLIMGLSFPIQSLVTSEAMDTKRAVQEVKEKQYKLHPEVLAYTQDYVAYLEGLANERTAAARSAYLVLPFDTDKGSEYAYAELMARAASLADGLQAAKIRSEILDSPATVNLLHHMLNRGRSWRPSDADAAGVMDMFHIFERQVEHAP